MKIKSGLMLREIAGQWVIVPLGERVVEFNSIMTLTESGAVLWKLLEKGSDEQEMVKALLSEYDVDEATAANDVHLFIENIKSKSICE